MKSNIDVLFFIEDPGAINFLKDLPGIFIKNNINFKIICHGVAKDFFKNHENVYCSNFLDANEIIESLNPSILIMGTSENPYSFAFDLTEAARQQSIYTISVIDMLCNAKNRFKGKTSDPLYYATDELFVADLKTKNEYVRLGFNQKNILITGNPIYEFALNLQNKSNTMKLNSTINVSEKFKILFISEGQDKLNLDATRKNINYKFNGRGQSDFRTIIVMEELIDALNRNNINAHTSLRVHPNSTLDNFQPIAKEFDEISCEKDPYKDVMNSDLIVGICSMLLLEASLLGKPTLSIMPDINELNLMPNNYFGTTHVASSLESLDNYFIEKKFLDYKYVEPAWVLKSSIEKIMNRVNELIMTHKN